MSIPFASRAVVGSKTFARNMREPRVQRLAVLRPWPHPLPMIILITMGAHFATKHVVPLGGLVHDLINRYQSKVHPLVRQDRSAPRRGAAQCHAGERIF